MRKVLLFGLSLGLIVSACSSSGELAEDQPAKSVNPQAVYMIGEELEKDREIEEWLEPHREILEYEMGERLATIQAPFRIGKPESPLGNLAADMIRFRAAHIFKKYVHLGLINEDSMRI